MSSVFAFAMGEFEAEFPNDYSYAKNHMWALPIAASEGSSRFRFGLTAYAVRLLQDVYFLDWIVDAPCSLQARRNIGSIESKKAESDLYSPINGTLERINAAVLDDPALINADPYGEGWMLEIQTAPADAHVLLSPEQYAAHLIDAWEVAQRTIKGQANT